MARYTNGWIKLHRSLAEKDIVQNMFLFSLWIYLLMIANYKESQIIWQGKQRILQPGQCLMKMRELSDKWECSPTTIWKWLHYLSDSERITIESRTHGTIITICNWKEYQIPDEEVRTPSEHQVNTPRTPSEHEVDYNEEVQERKKRTHGGIRVNYPPEFDSLWKQYGIKGDKKASYVEFKRLNLSPGELANLSTAIRNYQARKPDAQYRKDFERYLKTDWREDLKTYANGHAQEPLTKEERIERGFDLPEDRIMS